MTEPNLSVSSDLIDQLIADWKRSHPELDASSMAVVGRLIRIGSHLRESAGQALKPYNLHYTDFDVLATLRRSGPPYRLTPTALLQSVLLSSGAMTAALNRLKKRGLIARVTTPDDGRVHAVQLTEAGKNLSETSAKARFEEANSAVAGLTALEQEQLASLLRKLNSIST